MREVRGSKIGAAARREKHEATSIVCVMTVAFNKHET